MAEIRRFHAGELDRLLATLASWEPNGGCGAGLQAGDLGWMLRFGPDHLASRVFEGVDESGTTRLILSKDSDADWWCGIDPISVMDADLATVFAAWIEREGPAGALSIDGPSAPAEWRLALARRGFEATGEPWAILWRPLDRFRSQTVEGVVSTADPANIEDRVMVQRAAFENSTFTVERWHLMAAGPGFDPRFDLLARDDDGAPAAAATFWFAGAGKCTRLEPMGTHPAHRRKGHGLRLIAAACDLLARAGASGISVTTPMSNDAAVGLYRAAGFRLVGTSVPMVRQEESSRTA
ncbi:MAG TPA: GNAT family N-acetyltransferase [Thermomicrobiales bacterium]|nr:GNAT family N-acetyltransferase [Thermomicrobiales bacterium]